MCVTSYIDVVYLSALSMLSMKIASKQGDFINCVVFLGILLLCELYIFHTTPSVYFYVCVAFFILHILRCFWPQLELHTHSPTRHVWALIFSICWASQTTISETNKIYDCRSDEILSVFWIGKRWRFKNMLRWGFQRAFWVLDGESKRKFATYLVPSCGMLCVRRRRNYIL